MTNIDALINALHPDELSRLSRLGKEEQLDPEALESLDRAAGGPGEGRGYYVVRGSLEPRHNRSYYLREDVAVAIDSADKAANAVIG